MINQGEAPLVPEVAPKRRNSRQSECDSNAVREEIDALRMEAPFVPLVSPKRTPNQGVQMPNTD